MCENLRYKSYCSLCFSVSPCYADAFTHSAEFKCILLRPQNAVDCPVEGCGEKHTSYHAFAKHMSTHKRHLFDHFSRNSNPAYVTLSERKRRTARDKAKSVLWQLAICKKLYEGRSDNSKQFLPHLSSGLLASTAARRKEMSLCPFTICVCIGQQGIFSHQHMWETLQSGRCYHCSNFHQIINNYRICKRNVLAGTLPP